MDWNGTGPYNLAKDNIKSSTGRSEHPFGYNIKKRSARIRTVKLMNADEGPYLLSYLSDQLLHDKASPSLNLTPSSYIRLADLR